jgi:DNA-binding NarL/FixJ family response regulator
MNMLLKFEPELTIAGESKDASSLLDRAKELQPDLILIDWELLGSSAASLIEQLRESETLIVVLARRSESEQAARAAGADAFVSKTDPADSLLETLHKLFKPQQRGHVAVTR